jgi:hypothetical protein
MGPINTGFLYFSPTFQMKIFLKTMENIAMVKGTSDQKLFNHLLRHVRKKERKKERKKVRMNE